MAGNLVIAQSGGPTAVINASLAGVMRSALASSRIGGVYGAIGGTQGILNEELIDLGHESARTLELLRQTPGAALGTSRLRLKEEYVERLFAVLAMHDIRYLCLIGGNDSMDTAHRITDFATERGYELHVVGVPKTVDNDLAHTDHCPGYGSAARFVAATMRDTGIDSRSGKLSTPVKIVEIMGRHAGWLTAAAALARAGVPDGAPHLIYVPERPVSLDEFIADIDTAYRERGYVVAALSEGVRTPNGEFLGLTDATVDAFGHQQLGGVSAILAQEVSRKLGLKARFEKPDTMQRSSAALVSYVDRAEAFMVGQEAVRAIEAGETGKMITLDRDDGPEYRCHAGLVDVRQVAGAEKRLPDKYLAADGRDVTPAFIDYACPLIGEPLLSVATLEGHLVEKHLPPWR